MTFVQAVAFSAALELGMPILVRPKGTSAIANAPVTSSGAGMGDLCVTVISEQPGSPLNSGTNLSPGRATHASDAGASPGPISNALRAAADHFEESRSLILESEPEATSSLDACISLRNIVDDIRKLKPIAPSVLAAASRVVEKLGQQEKDVDIWAKRLARDFVVAGEK